MHHGHFNRVTDACVMCHLTYNIILIVNSGALLKYFGAGAPTVQNEESDTSTAATDVVLESDEGPFTSAATQASSGMVLEPSTVSASCSLQDSSGVCVFLHKLLLL